MLLRFIEEGQCRDSGKYARDDSCEEVPLKSQLARWVHRDHTSKLSQAKMVLEAV